MKSLKKIKTIIKAAEPVHDFLESWKKINPEPTAVLQKASSKASEKPSAKE